MNKIYNVIISNKIIFVVILIIIISGLVYFFTPYIKHFGQMKFVIEDFDIEFYAPKEWEKIKDKDLDRYNEKAKVGYTKNSSSNTSFIIKIDDEKGKKTLNTKNAISNIKKIYPEQLEDFDLINIEESTFNGIPSVQFEYTYSIRTDITGGKQVTQQKQILFLKDEKIYWLMFAAYPEDFENDMEDFEEIIDTFQFKD